jgi:hypothetical protein
MALGNGHDPVPAVYGAGLTRQTKLFLFAMDASTWEFAGTQDYTVSMGAERWFKDRLGLRAGGGLGSRDYKNVSVGLSYRIENMQMDYALAYPLQGSQQISGIHLVSLTFRFWEALPTH